MAVAELTPIQTYYKGFHFRSRLEARYAVLLDELGVRWTYEQEGFDLGESGRYLPDFWLPDLDLFMEVKPRYEWWPELIYLAGSCSTNWRSGLNLYGNFAATPVLDFKHDTFAEYVFTEAAEGIRDCSTFFAWLDRADCFGTLVEIGMAFGLQKRIAITIEEQLASKLPLARVEYDYDKPAHDLWFAKQCALVSSEDATPQAAIDGLKECGFIKPMPKEISKIRALAGAAGKSVWIVTAPEHGNYSQDMASFAAVEATPYGGYRRDYFFKMFTKRHGSLDLNGAFNAFRSARFEHGQCGAT